MKKSKGLVYPMVLFLSFLNFESDLISHQWVQAAAKTPPGSCGPGSPYATPFPVRNVILTPIGTKVFNLPNGVAVDLGADLQTMLMTSATQSSVFSPSDLPSTNPGDVPGGPCAEWVELRSAVTSFQLSAGEVSVNFGYTPSGSLGPVTGINSKVNVKIGTVAMDFSAWFCEKGNCSAIVASTANHLTAGVQLDLTVDFSQMNTGANFVYNTPIGDILRKIMDTGLRTLVSHSNLNELPWRATVKQYIPAAGIFIFDAGSTARLKTNEGFEVYAAANATGSSCDVYRMVALAHSTAVGTAATTATVDQVLDPAGVQVGDIVMIHQNSGQ